MDAREQRGLVIAAKHRIKRNGKEWIVPSQTKRGEKYTVVFEADKPRCTCHDHELRGCKCKHIFAVQYAIEREENEEDGSVTITETLTQVVKKKTYKQNWPKYNAAQTHEKLEFQVLLRDLCKGIPDIPPSPKGGRPRIPLRDLIFAAVFKVYSTVSGRRFMCDLRDAFDKDFIGKVPCFNSIFSVLESPDMFDLLKSLVVESATPLKILETNFACDSSGFSGCRFERWYDHKFGEHRFKRAWVKTHIFCGVRTNVVTAVEIHEQYSNDGPLLPPMLETTKQNFTVNEVSADLGYLSENNFQAIADAGAAPFIPFKCNSAPTRDGIWNKMFHYFNLHRDEFLSRYHQRSNVETTFSMVKAKFGDSVRSKTDVAMKNEVLCKLIAHNLCCLIEVIYESGLCPEFWLKAEPSGPAERLA
jgi:Transposase DDE domain